MKILLLTTMMTLSAGAVNADSIPVLFGTNTGGRTNSYGIYASYMNMENGRLGQPVKLAAEIDIPGFLTQHPTLPVVYSMGIVEGGSDGIVRSYKVTTKGNYPELTEINTVQTNCIKGAHIAIDPSGKMLVTAQYHEGTVAVLPVNQDGSIGEPTQKIEHSGFSNANPRRQEAPHPHNVTFSPCGKFALVPDLGADKTYIYKVDLDAMKLQSHGEFPCAPGAGPRHMVFSPDGRFAYIFQELNLTVDSCHWDSEKGTLVRIGTYQSLPDTLIQAEQLNGGSEIRIHPSGKFVYTANRGNDSISVFAVDQQTGALERIQIMPVRAACPRNFNIDPSGAFIVCAGQDSHNAGSFIIDQDSGRLTYVRASSVIVPAPICVLFPR